MSMSSTGIKVLDFIKTRKPFLVANEHGPVAIIIAIDLKSACEQAKGESCYYGESEDKDLVSCKELPLQMDFAGKTLFEHMKDIVNPIDQKIVDFS